MGGLATRPERTTRDHPEPDGGTPGRAPIGYLNVRKRTADGRELRTIEIDEDRAPHVEWAFDAYASGAYTLDMITAELAERGLRTRATPKYPARPLPGPASGICSATPTTSASSAGTACCGRENTSR